jgi:hypothetical protein
MTVSFMGSNSTRSINGRKTINIPLRGRCDRTTGVKIRSYYSVKRKKRTNRSVHASLQKTSKPNPSTNVLATIQGRMAGVNITQTSGYLEVDSIFKFEDEIARTDGNSPLPLWMECR